MCVYIYIYIYIERERDVYTYDYIYIYIYTHTYMYIPVLPGYVYVHICTTWTEGRRWPPQLILGSGRRAPIAKGCLQLLFACGLTAFSVRISLAEISFVCCCSSFTDFHRDFGPLPLATRCEPKLISPTTYRPYSLKITAFL